MDKILVILGPTATGKSALGVALAQKYKGEILSADSRQVYKHLDVGTGKVHRDSTNDQQLTTDDYFHREIRHHLLDVVEPTETYTVAKYKKDAEAAIDDILARKKVPIVVGGTGFYIQAVVDNIVPPEVPPDKRLRRELGQKETHELLEQLHTLDPDRAETVEPDNKRRIIRAIEIVRALGSVPPPQKPNPRYKSLQIGLDLADEELKEHIQVRVRERLKKGWIKEVQGLLDLGVSEDRMTEFGLGYALITKKLQELKKDKEIYSTVLQNSRIDLEEKITAAEWQYAKRQRQWFKRDERIHWCRPTEIEKIEQEVKKFLNS